MVSMERTGKTTKQTAAECYADRFRECRDLLKRVDARLDVHAGTQKQFPANWGDPGDLGCVTEQLTYVLASLGDRSAVDAKGLKY